MMGFLRDWILAVTAVSILLAAVRCFTAQAGGVGRVGQLAGGLALLLAVAAPLMELDISSLSLALTEYRATEWESAELLELENTRLVKTIIEEETAAYIAEKAAGLGVQCTVEVALEYGEDGQVWPVGVTVRGDLTGEQREALSRIIEADLAIPPSGQVYEGVSDG